MPPAPASSFRPPIVIPAKAGIQGVAGVALITPNHSHQPAPQFSYLGVPAPAGMDDWYENAPTRLSSAPLNPSIPRSRHSGPSIRHSREGGNPGEAYGWQMTRTQLLQSAPRFSYLGVPAPAGISDCYENMSRTTIRDRLPTRHSGESRSPGVGNPVAPELLSSQGSPTQRDFHPLMRPSQGHGDSGERWNPEGEGKGKTMAILAIDAVWALRLRQLAELARPYTKTTQRRGQT